MGRVSIQIREVVMVEAEAVSPPVVVEEGSEALLLVPGMAVVLRLQVLSGPQHGPPQEVSFILLS